MAAVAFALSACSGAATEKTGEHAEDAHNHAVHNHAAHNKAIVGVAQEGDAASGKITIAKLDGSGMATFDYSKANQDKIAAWLAGDTVTVFLSHHHHGGHHHEDVVKVKIGNFPMAEGVHVHGSADGHKGHDGHTHNH